MDTPPSQEEARRVAEAHAKACASGEETYEDPVTLETVFTRRYLEERGWCCQQGCRHCPYGETHIIVRYKNPPPG